MTGRTPHTAVAKWSTADTGGSTEQGGREGQIGGRLGGMSEAGGGTGTSSLHWMLSPPPRNKPADMTSLSCLVLLCRDLLVVERLTEA